MTREEFRKALHDFLCATDNNVMYINTLVDEYIEQLQAPKTCNGCSWYFKEVCTNDGSPLCCDFVSKDYGCIYYEPKDK